MTVADNTVTTVGKLQVGHGAKKRIGFSFNSLRKKPSGTSAQNISQWIIERVGLRK